MQYRERQNVFNIEKPVQLHQPMSFYTKTNRTTETEKVKAGLFHQLWAFSCNRNALIWRFLVANRDLRDRGRCPQRMCTLIHRLAKGSEPRRGRGAGVVGVKRSVSVAAPNTRDYSLPFVCGSISQPAELRHRCRSRRLQRAGWCTAAISKLSVGGGEGRE